MWTAQRVGDVLVHCPAEKLSCKHLLVPPTSSDQAGQQGQMLEGVYRSPSGRNLQPSSAWLGTSGF